MEVKSAIQIINQPHPVIPTLGREFSAQAWRAGETAREALLRAGLDPHSEIVILINDRMLEVAEWDHVIPQPGDLVHAVAAVSGSGGDSGGSNPLKIILTVVVMVAAFYLGPALGAAMGFSGTAAAAVGGTLISLAGNLVIGAVFKSSTGALSATNGSSETASPTYSLSGGSNSIRAYGPMQVVMGAHRMFPDYGAKPFTEFWGEDQYLYQIFNFGLSAMQFTDLRIGDSPLSNYSSVALYWSDTSGAIPQFPGNVDSDTGGTLTRGADWIVRTSAVDAIRLAVDTEGSIYYSGDSGLLPCSVRIEAQYRPEGSADWVPMMYGTAVTYTTGFWSLQTVETVYVEDYSGSGGSGDGGSGGGSDGAGDSGDSSSSSDSGDSGSGGSDGGGDGGGGD